MSTRLLENILNQPQALRQVARYQLGEGREALLRCAELLRSKKKIVLSGMGASCFACLPLQYALSKRGMEAITIDSAELLYFLPSLVDSETAIVLVSRSGESVEVIKLLPTLRDKGTSIVGVVNVPESTLGTQAGETIALNSPADQMVAIQTYTGTLAAFALLEAAMFDELDRAQEDINVTTDLLSTWIPECVSVSEQWRAFLDSRSPLYLLGRGSALGSVFEGALLQHETAKAPAVGMTAAQFRHGPVEVVDEKFRAIVIGTQAATASLETSLAHDLIRMGGRVRWIGRAIDGVESLHRWPEDIPERFAPLAEILPLQMAAYRNAELRGVRPGDFRWAPLVTTSEASFSFPDSTRT